MEQNRFILLNTFAQGGDLKDERVSKECVKPPKKALSREYDAF